MRKRKKRAGRWLSGVLAWMLALTMMSASSFAALGAEPGAAPQSEESSAQPEGSAGTGGPTWPGEDIGTAVAEQPEGNAESVAAMAEEAAPVGGEQDKDAALAEPAEAQTATAPTPQEVMDAIAAKYAASGIDTTDYNAPWIAADMAAYAKAFPDTANKLTDKQKADYLAVLIPAAVEATKPGDLAKYIIVLRSMGYDARKVVSAEGKVIDIVKKLTDLVDAKNTDVTNMYTLPYVLIALQQGKDYATQEQMDYLKKAIVDSQGEWQKENWGSIDAVLPMISALAPYSNEAAVKTALDSAVEFMKGYQLDTGAIARSQELKAAGTGNASTTGITMAAMAAVGTDPATVKNGDKSLTDGLMTYVSSTKDGFGPDTERSFRGLLAATLQSQGKGRVYDFYSMPMNYTDGERDLSVTVKVITHDGNLCGGKWTYKANVWQYKTPVSATVTVKSGSSAFDATILALKEKGISYELNEKGNYFKNIAGDADSGHGSTKSGWSYHVDGVRPQVGSPDYKLDSDVTITWVYTDDYSREAAFTMEDVYKSTMEYLTGKASSIQVGTEGGEWLLIGLARSGALTEKMAADYYAAAEKYVKDNINGKEQLHSSKSTDNARMILALTAIGKDAANVAGHNLFAGLTDLDYVKKQGVNGPIWALVAFDSHNYDIPAGGTVTRDSLIQAILDAQLSDGGWSLKGEKADADITGMALYALAPYQSTSGKVQDAVAKGTQALSDIQQTDGGYVTGTDDSKDATAESCVHALMAMTALGIDPSTDSRFIKNGNSVLDALLGYYAQGGGFRHIAGGEVNAMATEQGYIALTSYRRVLEGKSSLYDMKEIVIDKAAVPEPTPVVPEPTPVVPEPTPVAPEPAPATPAKAYRILEGTDGSWTANDDGSVAIRADGALEDFVSLKVDGKLADPSNYTLKAGSTIATLKPEFLKSLGQGDHQVTFVYKDGEISMNLPLGAGGTPVRKADTKKLANIANTGDESAPAVYGAALLAAAACIAAVYGMRRKNQAGK